MSFAVFAKYLKTFENQSDLLFEWMSRSVIVFKEDCFCLPVKVLAYSVACVGVSAFSRGLIDAAKAEEIMNTLRTLTEESQQVSGSLLG